MKRLNIDIPSHILNQIEETAEVEGITTQDIVIEMLEVGLLNIDDYVEVLTDND